MPYLVELNKQKHINTSGYATYFDFGKTFDLVHYHFLLQKLANFGFDEKFLTLFNSYLDSNSKTSVNLWFLLQNGGH